MADQNVTIRLTAEIGAFKAAMSEATNASKSAASNIKSSWSTAGDGAASSASKTQKAWSGIDSGAVSAVGRVDKAWSSAGIDATGVAAKIRGSWNGVEVPGVSGAKLVSSAWSASGEEAATSANGVRSAWGGVGGFTDSLIAKQREHAHAWQQVSTTAVVSGGVITAGIGGMVKAYADFDTAMSNVKADTHETTGNLNLLREAAIRAGADTAYSATEAAQGIDELAKAGVSTKDILSGGLTGALSLAAAGQLDVGEAAETAASAMTQFGLKGTNLSHVADLLSAGAGKAQGSVHDMGAALKQTGLIASQSGLSIEETTGGLAAFASAGLTGSDAGTSFKTMLQRLQAPSKESKAMLDGLGITMYDQQGKFVGLANLAGQLHDKMGGLTDAQRSAAMATIFGSDAVRSANVLYTQGQTGIQGWIDKVNDTGYAAETAAAKQDNLRGDLEKLGGSMETVFLRSGSGANDALRFIVQFVGRVVDKIGQIPGPVLSASAAIAGIGGAALVAVGGGMKLTSFLSEFKGNLENLGVAMTNAEGSSTRMGRAINGVGKGLGALAIAGTIAAGISALGEAMADATVGANSMENALADSSAGISQIDAAFKNSEWANGPWWDGHVRNINGVSDALVQLGAAGPHMSRGMVAMEKDIGNLDDALANMVSKGSITEATQAFGQFMDEVKSKGGNVDEAVARFPKLKAAIEDYATTQHVTLTDSEKLDAMMSKMPDSLAAAADGADKAKDGIAGMGQASQDTAQSMSDVVKGLEALGLAHISVAEAESKFQEFMADVSEAVKDINEKLGGMGQALNDSGTGFDLTTEAGRKAQGAFLDASKAGLDYAKALANADATQQDIVKSLHQTYNGLIQSAGQFGITGQAADQLARYVMGIPDNKSIETWMSDFANGKAKETKGSVDSIPGQKSVDITATDRGTVGAVQAKVDSIHGATPEVLVTDRGTSRLTQGQINDIRGKTTKVEVTDQGTVYTVQGAINGITDGDATIFVTENGVASVQNAINSVRGRQVFIDVMTRYHNQGMSLADPSLHGGATGGQVGSVARGTAGVPMRGFATGGGLIPGARPVNRLKDNLRAMVMDTGEMIGVQSTEFILNSDATAKNRRWVEWMNSGGVIPGNPRDLKGHRGFVYGGSPSPGYGSPASGFIPRGRAADEIAGAVSAALASWRPMVQIGGREFYGQIQMAERQYGSRR